LHSTRFVWQEITLKASILGGIVLFSNTIGVEAGEYLWYVLNFNTLANR